MNMKMFLLFLVPVMILSSCHDQQASLAQSAEVRQVDVRGDDGSYTFSVTIKSPDKGCEQYADWWEVITPNGELLYRRILLHSHVSEQPFTRSGGPVPAGGDRELIIRAHMNNLGYGTRVLRGTVAGGFRTAELDQDFAEELAGEDPLPSGCGF